MKFITKRSSEFFQEIIEEQSIEKIDTELSYVEAVLLSPVEVSEQIKKELLNVIRKIKPDVVMIKHYLEECKL